MAGFDAVPDELRETAGRIGDAVGGVAGLMWQGPSGDYGHSGVQTAWGTFIEQLRAQVEALRDKAEEFGGDLGQAANRYLDTEAETNSTLAGLGGLLEQQSGALGAAAGGVAGGALGGGIGAALGGAAGGALGGSIGNALNSGAPSSAPGDSEHGGTEN
ncbi:hypothetical protein [Saccharomonospora piscinae]|uniref:hypothetical protein n=1 Tax=Saccharomonospora piscinae TaxID=687388 RepID=UPI00046551D9|nr:hypothetical protein [Saccharomonospora piscinae]